MSVSVMKFMITLIVRVVLKKQIDKILKIEKALLKQWAEDHRSQAHPSGVKQFWLDPSESASENKAKQL